MSNSYISYLKRRNPIKYISNILRRYRRPPAEKAKPIGTDRRPLPKEVKIKEEPKEEEVAEEPHDDFHVLWSSGGGRSLGNDSSISLDYDLREKIGRIPFSRSEGGASADAAPARRMYPWQNFTLDTVPSRAKFQPVKSVDSLAGELINNRRTIVKKSDSFKVAKQKKVKINRAAMMMVYSKCGEKLGEQARINLSTNSGCFKRKPDVYRLKSGYNHRKCLRCSSKLKYTPTELTNFWCTNKEGLSSSS